MAVNGRPLAETDTPSGLSGIAAAAPGRGPAPVERWNPPYCGDVGLEIRADGSWWHQGRPIMRPELVRLFARVLRKDADGRTYLVTPAEKVDIRVADAAFVGVEVRAGGAGEAGMVHVRTNFDDWVTIGAAHPLRFAPGEGGGLKPYVVVRGRLEARLNRPAYLDLVGSACERGRALGLWSGGLWWEMGPAAGAGI